MNIRKLLNKFDKTAQHWGYIESEGSGSSITESKKKYITAKQVLLDEIERLEKMAGVIHPTPPPVENCSAS